MNSQLLEKLYNRNFSTPLDVGLFKIEQFHHASQHPQIFVMNGEAGLDLIDFWNFRSIYPHLIPIPYEQVDLSNFLKNIITDLQGILPGSTSEIHRCPNIVFSRSISILESEKIYSQTLLRPEQQISKQDWFPIFWRNSQYPDRQFSRVTLRATQKTCSVNINTTPYRAEFETLYPSFENTSGTRFACANVVKINQSYSDTNNIATVYPVDCKDSLSLELSFSPLISTTEGLTVFPNFLGETNFWTLNDGATVFQNWFNRHEIKTSISSAGRATEQILRVLPNSAAISCIRCKGIIEQLNAMTSKLTRSENLDAFDSKIKQATKVGKKICHQLQNLIKYGIVKLGCEVKCYEHKIRLDFKILI